MVPVIVLAMLTVRLLERFDGPADDGARARISPTRMQTLAPHRLVIDDPVEHERKPEGEEEREIRRVGEMDLRRG